MTHSTIPAPCLNSADPMGPVGDDSSCPFDIPDPIDIPEDELPFGPRVDQAELENLPCGSYPETLEEVQSIPSLLRDLGLEARLPGRTLCREEITRQLMGALIGMSRPNAILVGPAGSGKTRIVEDLAWRLEEDDPVLPSMLRGYHIYGLQLSDLVAGSNLVGQVEEKVKEVLRFATDSDNQAILFIDEIHQMAKAENPAYQKIAQILKPALSRGALRVIGATTTQEARCLATDPAFSRRFTTILVDELTRAQTEEVLLSMKESFLDFYGHGIRLEDSLMHRVVALADEYSQAQTHRPDNAITLLDRSIADAIVQARARRAARKSRSKSGRGRRPGTVLITEDQVRQTAIRLATGNSKPEVLDERSLTSALSLVKGQEDILDQLILELKKHELNLFPSKKPLTLLFIGPSGVGKTEVTKIIAREVTGCEPIVLNMTEYNHDSSVNRILGSVTGYIGYDSNQELPFDILSSNPYQVILLDEFEKCDRAVQRLFMQVFDEGVLRTNRGTVIDFSHSIIIATTNAGHQRPKSVCGFRQEEARQETTEVQDIAPYFDLALLNRFRERITFHSLNEKVYRQILQDRYERARRSICSARPLLGESLPGTLPPGDLDRLVADTYVPAFGARPAQTAVEDYIYSRLL